MRDHAEADAVFDALGEPVRRTILRLLTAGPRPVGQLAEHLPVGRPAVSKHLRVLSDAGLVRHESVGTRNLYALAPSGMVTAQQWLVATWDSALRDYAAAVRDDRDRPGTDSTTAVGPPRRASRRGSDPA
jgi:DNA-binding transcriptional ArsR family regulator